MSDSLFCVHEDIYISQIKYRPVFIGVTPNIIFFINHIQPTTLTVKKYGIFINRKIDTFSDLAHIRVIVKECKGVFVFIYKKQIIGIEIKSCVFESIHISIYTGDERRVPDIIRSEILEE